MVNPDTKHGILNDRALGYARKSGPSGNERTGTVAFMAMDLLWKNIGGEKWNASIVTISRD